MYFFAQYICLCIFSFDIPLLRACMYVTTHIYKRPHTLTHVPQNTENNTLAITRRIKQNAFEMYVCPALAASATDIRSRSLDSRTCCPCGVFAQNSKPSNFLHIHLGVQYLRQALHAHPRFEEPLWHSPVSFIATLNQLRELKPKVPGGLNFPPRA